MIEDFGVVDADELIARGMHDQRRSGELGSAVTGRGTLEFVEKGSSDGEGAAGDGDRSGAVTADGSEVAVEQVDDMGGVGGCADGGHGTHAGQVGCGGEDRCATEGVAHQQAGCGDDRREVVRGGAEVGDVVGEAGVGEVTAAAAQAGKVERQHSEPGPGQRCSELSLHPEVLAAGETVSEHRRPAHGAGWPLQARGELLASCPGESAGAGGPFGAGTHGVPPAVHDKPQGFPLRTNEVVLFNPPGGVPHV